MGQRVALPASVKIGGGVPAGNDVLRPLGSEICANLCANFSSPTFVVGLAADRAGDDLHCARLGRSPLADSDPRHPLATRVSPSQVNVGQPARSWINAIIRRSSCGDNATLSPQSQRFAAQNAANSGIFRRGSPDVDC